MHTLCWFSIWAQYIVIFAMLKCRWFQVSQAKDDEITAIYLQVANFYLRM